MVFSSIVFLFLFFPAVLAIYYGLLRKNRSRNLLLLAASLLFYAWGEPVYVLLMIGSTIGNYFFGVWTDRYREQQTKIKWILISMLVFNLGILGVFKYAGFAVNMVNKAFSLDLTVPEIALPIGISFFTFHGISYVIDIYKRKAEALKNPLDVGLYISFFPQLVAGPIVRFSTIAKEINGRKENESDFVSGIVRFIEGMAIKVLLANSFALVADKAFSLQGDQLSVAFAWMGAVAYALQIFFDFAGYSAMAIGLAKMFGFHFLENFNAPYVSKTVSEFWRRWHISLGSWFRDYVYIPLGGSRVSKWKIVRNLFVVWFLTGLWHGASMTFIAWGLYFFVFIMIEKLFKLEAFFGKFKVLGHVYLLVVVLFGWVLFRATSFTHAMEYIRSMFGMNGNELMGDMARLYLNENLVLFIAGIIFCLPFKTWIQERQIKLNLGVRSLYGVALTVVFFLSIAYLVKGSYNPFIYFNF